MKIMQVVQINIIYTRNRRMAIAFLAREKKHGRFGGSTKGARGAPREHLRSTRGA